MGFNGTSINRSWVIGAAAGAGLLLARRLRATGPEPFRDRVVLITGGSRGLGLAMARQFAARGARLILFARTADQLELAAQRLRSSGARVDTIVGDVRKRDDVRAAVDRVIRVHGRIDVLVNNAGIIQMTPFVHAQVSDFEDSLNTHFWGPLFFIEACLPHFRRQRSGRIVNISSVGGRVALPHFSPYCAGKFALAGLSDVLHAELAPLGISVTTVSPFLMRTGSHRNATVRGQHQKEAAWFALGVATPLTSFSADRAARTIVEAVAKKRARVAPGWPSRAAEVMQAVAPGMTAALAVAAVRWLLPGPSRSGDGNVSRRSRDLNLGSLARWFSTEAADRWNQQVAPDERRVRPRMA